MGIQKPAWLEALYSQQFFVGCSFHEDAKKNEKNICCLDCCISICPHCLSSHPFHRLLQVRRYVYHDVVRLEDLQNLIDSSNVQPYTINNAKVVFIKKRPQSRQFKGSGNYCTSCDRSLQEPYIHCSLGCKGLYHTTTCLESWKNQMKKKGNDPFLPSVDYVLKHKRDLTLYLRPYNSLPLNMDILVPQETGGDETTNDTLRSTIVDYGELMSSPSDSENSSIAHTPIIRKKRSGLCRCERSTRKISSEDMATSISLSRRKGIPHRSPLC